MTRIVPVIGCLLLMISGCNSVSLGIDTLDRLDEQRAVQNDERTQQELRLLGRLRGLSPRDDGPRPLVSLFWKRRRMATCL